MLTITLTCPLPVLILRTFLRKSSTHRTIQFQRGGWRLNAEDTLTHCLEWTWHREWASQERPSKSGSENCSLKSLCCLVTQSNQTLCDPKDSRLPGSSVHGFPRQEYWSGLPFPSPGDLLDPGVKSMSTALTGVFFTTEPPGGLAWRIPRNP